MTLDEFRLQMRSYRKAADAEAASLKDSYLALDRLHALYEKFDAQERAIADKVLAEWVLSEDENLRFDALALVDDFGVKEAIPALQDLAGLLASRREPGAPHELQKVRRIVADLKRSA